MQELTLREIQLETLKIMKIIHNICEQESLKYSLFYGSLIGAVRHNGFIPWDDDLDIVMPRNDYDKLEKYFIEHSEKLKPFKLFSYKTVKDYPFFINRICNTEFEMFAENEKNCGMGTFIDIYPFDAAGDGNIKRVLTKSRFYSSMYFMKSRLNFVSKKNFLKNFLKHIVHFISHFFTLTQLQKKLEKLSKKYNYENSSHIANIVWDEVKNKETYLKTDFEDLIKIKFEDAEFFIPKNYDKILTECYGDYMKLPPEEERVGHHFYKIFKTEVEK